MSLTFNIADLHGRSDLLDLAINAIDKYIVDRIDVTDPDSGNKPTLVFTGDYIDRGPDSKGVITLVKFLQTEKKVPSGLHFDKVIALKGNHETFMLEAQEGEGIGFWTSFNGGDLTYRSYGFNVAKAGLFPQEHIEWVKNLPLYYDDGKRVYVHAGIRNYEKPLSEQKEDDLIWMLYGQKRPWAEGDGLTNSPPYFGKHVVHGHHQFKTGPLLLDNRSNFDTLAWYTGRLVIGVFDNDKEGGPIDTIEVKGDPARLLK
jgi:serine/threonine protein phosphatase 1